MLNHKKIEDYTEAEFLDLITKIVMVDTATGEEHDELIDHFVDLTQHPKGSDLFFYPEDGVDKTPEELLEITKQWLESQNRPGFKQESI